MKHSHAHDAEAPDWVPPDTFRELLADVERMAGAVRDTVTGQLLVPAHELEFTLRRLHQMAAAAYDALPPEVS